MHLNGCLTLGENTADNGGVRIAYMALEDTLKGQQAPLRDGFTPEQRLFLGWAQGWCESSTPQSAKLRAQTDPHSPGRYRVDGVFANMPEFQKAYKLRAESEDGAGERLPGVVRPRGRATRPEGRGVRRPLRDSSRGRFKVS